MLRRSVGLVALGVAPALVLAACSSDSGDDAVVDDKGVGRVPPAAPSGPQTAGGNDTTLAISKLYLGDQTRTGELSDQAWKEIGFNLDGRLSTKDSTQHCTPPSTGLPNLVKTDGTDGIDNAFGSTLIPLIKSLAQTAVEDINASVAQGAFTIIISADLGPETETTATGIAAKLHAGAIFGSLLAECTATPPTDPNCIPNFDGTDVWPLAPIGTTTDPKTVDLPLSFMVDGTWVSGSKHVIDLGITLAGIEFTMSITEAVVVMDVTGRGTSATAKNGTIAGVLDTEVLISKLRNVAGSVNVGLCEGATFDAIAQQVRGASDIMKDGTNDDPARTCDAISVGIGFDAKGVTAGEVAPPVTPPPDLCPAP